MTTQKKFHYIPVFAQKHFSLDDSHINLVVLETLYHNSKMSIRNNAQKKSLYKPWLETTLSIVEGKFAKIVNEIITTKTLPDPKIVFDTSNPKREDYIAMLQYIISQRVRSFKHKRIQEELLDAVVKKLAQKPIFQKPIDFSSVTIKRHPDQFNERITDAIIVDYLLLSDLRAVLVKNETDVDFLLGDEHIAFFNLAYKNEDIFGTTGLASPGLMILVPINPNLCIILCDQWAYEIGTMKHEICITKEDDINEINKVIITNSQSAVFFKNMGDVGYVTSLIKDLKSLGVLDKADIKVKPIIENAPFITKEGGYAEVLHTRSRKIKYIPQFSFVDINEEYVDQVDIRNIRDPISYRNHAFMKLEVTLDIANAKLGMNKDHLENAQRLLLRDIRRFNEKAKKFPSLFREFDVDGLLKRSRKMLKKVDKRMEVLN